MPDIRSLVAVLLACLGIGAALIAFFRTPRERRFTVSSSLEEQLEIIPEKAQAVIIRGNKRAALLRSTPAIIAFGISLIFVIIIKNESPTECSRVFWVNLSYASLLIMLYVVPAGMLLFSIAPIGTSIKTLKTGYYPPLDSIMFNDAIAKKEMGSTLRGIIGVFVPVFY